MKLVAELRSSKTLAYVLYMVYLWIPRSPQSPNLAQGAGMKALGRESVYPGSHMWDLRERGSVWKSGKADWIGQLRER